MSRQSKVTGRQQFKARLEKLDTWTIIRVPFDVKKIFGTGAYVKIRGTIDGKPFNGISLMPMGKGTHCMSVNSALRKAIGKEAGALVAVVLEQDKTRLKAPVDFDNALAGNKKAKDIFDRYPPSHKKAYIEYIDEAKKARTRAERIEKAIKRIIEVGTNY
jgi:hypothetical protein